MKTILGKLEFSVERELVIRAPRKTVFQFFTDSARFARWWGAGSTIEGRVGGAVNIVYPGGTRAVGEVLELRAPERIVFSYGYEGEKPPIAPGASRVTFTFADHPQGTKLHFRHEVADAPTREHHVQGWRYHLAVFANVAANEAQASAAARADGWFAAWNETDATARHAAFAAIAAPELLFQDPYSLTSGLDDLAAHVTGAKVHMPPFRLERVGEPRHCQGTALVDWVAKMPDGQTMAKGTNVFELAADGRIARVVGLWG